MLTALLALYANIRLNREEKSTESPRLDSYAEACCMWMLFLFVVTELFSVFHEVRFITLAAAWAALDAVLLLMLTIRLKRSKYGFRKWMGGLFGGGITTMRQCPYYGILLLIGGIVLLLAWRTTPYNWDSMTYHLPRITYWVQNRSVEHYATNSIRQIASPMLAEFVNLNVYILCRGKDTLFNMLQAFSYITCAVLVGAIARKLGCSRLFRFVAVLIYMTMPIAYAEALTTQVDNFATVWLLFFVYLLLDLVSQEDNLKFDGSAVRKVCAVGICVAWGYLAKPSVCVAMVIFAAWLLIVCIARKDKFKELLGLALCALPCVALPLVPEILRNFRTFHAYASKSTGARQLVGTLQPSYLFVNFLKNFTFNMPTSLIADSQDIFVKLATKAAEILNVELNARSISESGGEFALHEANTYGCDTAINPIVMWLFVFCVLWALCAVRKTVWDRVRSGYLLTGTAAFCIFCAVLRWEPFVTRYMVSYLALICPMIAVQIQLRTEQEKHRPLRWGLVGIIAFLCVMEAVSVTSFHYDTYAHQGANRRPYGYFTARGGEAAYYTAITDEIKNQGYESVGLYLMKTDDYEYPIWELLEKKRIEHVNVQNESAVYADHDFTPDCIIWFGSLPEEPVTINDKTYAQVIDYGEKHYLMSE